MWAWYLGPMALQVAAWAGLWALSQWVVQSLMGLQARLAQPLMHLVFWLLVMGAGLAIDSPVGQDIIWQGAHGQRLFLFISGYFAFRSLRAFVAGSRRSAARSAIRMCLVFGMAIMGIFAEMRVVFYFLPIFMLLPIARLSLSTTWYRRLSPLEAWGKALIRLSGPLLIGYLVLNGAGWMARSPSLFAYIAVGVVGLWILEVVAAHHPGPTHMGLWGRGRAEPAQKATSEVGSQPLMASATALPVDIGLS